MTILVVNPLPHALEHYERELLGVLGPHDVVRPGIESADGSLLRRGLGQLSVRRRPEADAVLVLWPAFGRFDPLSWAWAAHRCPVHVVVHDPSPLRRQRGHGVGAARAEELARRADVRVIAHSAPARRELEAAGWSPISLPHPVLPGLLGPRREDGPVLVLGQHKPARTLRPLEALAAVSSLDGRRRVRGRGWPPVAGWDVVSDFLTESAFAAELAAASCLVLPYDRYFQSNVAVRAVELGVPVVADRHSFLESLYGDDWAGFVRGDDWAGAVRRVAAVPPAELVDVAARSAAVSESAWGAWARELRRR